MIVGDDLMLGAGESSRDVSVSHVASLSQLKVLSSRHPRPITEEPVFIASPRGDRTPAAVEAMLLRRSFYPRSVGLGELIDAADGPATPEAVRAHLGASLLHLACGVTAGGALLLAESTELDLSGTTVPAAGLAILPPDHFLPLADILLTAGYTGVIGWRRPVLAPIATVASFILHRELVDVGGTPAQAVRQTRRWLRNPDPGLLPPLLTGYCDNLAAADREDSACQLIYRGR